MGIWSAFSASNEARKISNVICSIWKDTVNFISFKDVDLKISGSVYILEQAYALSFFTYFTKHHPSQEKINQITYVTGNNIELVLLDVWGRHLPGDDLVGFIDETKNKLIPTFGEWFKEISACEGNKHLVGSGNFEGWTEAGLLKYIHEITNWYAMEFEGDGQLLSAQDKLDIHNFTFSYIKKLI